MTKTSDSAVIKTADDAVLSKLHASSIGYYDDPFLPYFSREASGLTTSASATDERIARSTTIAAPQRRSDFVHVTDARFPKRQRGAGQPMIRRGSYARVCCVDRAVSSFLSLSMDLSQNANLGRQVVVLGAGKDTTYLRYRAGLLTTPPLEQLATKDSSPDEVVRWYEIDFPSVVEAKRSILNSIPQIESILSANGSTSSSNSQSPSPVARSEHHLIGYDLRSPTKRLIQDLSSQHGFRLDAPTLFVIECVQMYLPEHFFNPKQTRFRCILQRFAKTISTTKSTRDAFGGLGQVFVYEFNPSTFDLSSRLARFTENDTRKILSTITEMCTTPILALYDPILLNDPFGKVMQDHLAKAGVANTSTSSITRTRTLQDQVEKLLSCGFHRAVGCDMLDAYETVLTAQQRHRANRCEMLDELEEWTLIMRHYCFVVAGKKGSITERLCAVGASSKLGFVENRCLAQSRHE